MQEITGCGAQPPLHHSPVSSVCMIPLTGRCEQCSRTGSYQASKDSESRPRALPETSQGESRGGRRNTVLPQRGRWGKFVVHLQERQAGGPFHPHWQADTKRPGTGGSGAQPSRQVDFSDRLRWAATRSSALGRSVSSLRDESQGDGLRCSLHRQVIHLPPVREGPPVIFGSHPCVLQSGDMPVPQPAAARCIAVVPGAPPCSSQAGTIESGNGQNDQGPADMHRDAHPPGWQRCTRVATFGDAAVGPRPVACANHRLASHQNLRNHLCLFNGCQRSASFGPRLAGAACKTPRTFLTQSARPTSFVREASLPELIEGCSDACHLDRCLPLD